MPVEYVDPADNHDPWDVVVITQWLDGLTLRRSLLVILEHRWRCFVHGPTAGDAWLLGAALHGTALDDDRDMPW